MTYQEALQYIHSIHRQGSRPGLFRTRALLEKIGNPQDKLRFVHVAGTNGKGSFCAMLSSVLLEAGYHVGTYTSPYILRFNERMKVDGKDIPDENLAELTEFIRPFVDSMEDRPTEFELITAIAMEYFAREKCEIVVLECGLGGRLDSTNVIKTPCLSVITGIALDHTAVLGDTIPKIAAEKAGILKTGVPVLFCGKDKSAEEVIAARAAEVGSPLFLCARENLEIAESTLEGTVFHWKNWKNISIPLLGSYQPENACNVLQAIALLQKSGFEIPDDAVRRGLQKVRWPARYEIVCHSPLILCDGAHNPEGVDAAVQSTKLYFKNKKVLVITGVLQDKDFRYMASRMKEIAQEVYCITPESPRALPAADFADLFRSLGVFANAYSDVEEALRAAIERAKCEKLAILCLGSLYMYEQVIGAKKKILN